MLARLRAAVAAFRGDEEKASAVGPLISQMQIGQPQWTPRRFDRLADEGFTQNIVVWYCVRLVASAIAGLPLMVFKGEAEQENHPLRKLLDRPNPLRGRVRFIEELVSYHLLAGNSYLEAVPGFSGTEPQELWAHRPDRVRAIPGPAGLPQAYRYEANGVSRDFPVDAMGRGLLLHMRDFHPLNDWYGLGPVEVAARWIDLDNAGGALNAALLQNSATPSAVFSFKQSLTPEQIEQAEAKLSARHGGIRNASKPMVLGGDWTVQKIAMTLQEMQWTEGMHEAARRICTAWGVPHVLVVPGESTFANRESADLELYEHTVLPRADLLVEDLNPWLQYLYQDDRLELRIDRDNISALEPRREARRKSLTEAAKEGLISVDEWRDALDYDEPDEKQTWLKGPFASAATLALEAQFAPRPGGPGGPGQNPPAGAPPARPGARPAPGGGKPPVKSRLPVQAAPRPLYAALRVAPGSAAALAKWAADQGVPNVVPPKEMHLTTVYSEAPVPAYETRDGDWDLEDVLPATYRLAFLGPNNALVLLLGSEMAEDCHARAERLGASWPHPGYQPHVTLSYEPQGVMPKAPPTFAITVGPEYAQPLDADEKGAGADPAAPFERKDEPPFDPSLLFDDDDFTRELLTPLRDTLRHFGNRVFTRLGLEIAFDVYDPGVGEFLRDFGAERVKGIGDTTRTALGDALARVAGDQPTFPKYLAAIRGTFEEASRARAEVIARTETTRAAGFAGQKAMIDAGVERKMWLSSRDAWVRDAHRELDGQTVKAEQKFHYHGHKADHPGGFGVPSLDINCRCVSIELPDDDEVQGKAVSPLRTDEGRAIAWKVYADELAHHEQATLAAVRNALIVQGMRAENRLRGMMGR